MTGVKRLYVAVCAFPYEGFLEALRASGVKGTLEVVEHVAEGGTDREWRLGMGGVCSGESVEQAGEVMGWYCEKKYPGLPPAELWVGVAPARFVKGLPRGLRKDLAAKLMAGPHGGRFVVRFREGTMGVEEIGDFFFDEAGVVWERVWPGLQGDRK
jgi:hypothetical protein